MLLLDCTIDADQYAALCAGEKVTVVVPGGKRVLDGSEISFGSLTAMDTHGRALKIDDMSVTLVKPALGGHALARPVDDAIAR